MKKLFLPSLLSILFHLYGMEQPTKIAKTNSSFSSTRQEVPTLQSLCTTFIVRQTELNPESLIQKNVTIPPNIEKKLVKKIVKKNKIDTLWRTYVPFIITPNLNQSITDKVFDPNYSKQYFIPHETQSTDDYDHHIGLYKPQKVYPSKMVKFKSGIVDSSSSFPLALINLDDKILTLHDSKGNEHPHNLSSLGIYNDPSFLTLHPTQKFLAIGRPANQTDIFSVNSYQQLERVSSIRIQNSSLCMPFSFHPHLPQFAVTAESDNNENNFVNICSIDHGTKEITPIQRIETSAPTEVVKFSESGKLLLIISYDEKSQDREILIYGLNKDKNAELIGSDYFEEDGGPTTLFHFNEEQKLFLYKTKQDQLSIILLGKNNNLYRSRDTGIPNNTEFSRFLFQPARQLFCAKSVTGENFFSLPSFPKDISLKEACLLSALFTQQNLDPSNEQEIYKFCKKNNIALKELIDNITS